MHLHSNGIGRSKAAMQDVDKLSIFVIITKKDSDQRPGW